MAGTFYIFFMPLKINYLLEKINFPATAQSYLNLPSIYGSGHFLSRHP